MNDTMKNNHYLKYNEVVSQRIKSLLTSDSSVYMQYFGMKEKPFRCSPNPEYVYLSASHNEALSLMIYAISYGEGFAALTGDAGTGKTTLIHLLLANLDEQYSAARILNPQMNSISLLKAINAEFGLPADTNDKYSLMDELERFLIRQKAEGKKSFLIIDEAQELEEAVLEQLRLLSNLESSASKLLHIILVGTQDLVQKINSHPMQHLNQRIGVQCRLEPMSALDTRAYIHHRLKAAAAKNRVKFTRMACRYIHFETHGIPRLVNRLCDVSLMGAYCKQRKKITALMVARAGREITCQHGRGAKKSGILFGRRAVGTALMGMAIFGTILTAVHIVGTYMPSQQLSAILAPSAENKAGAADLSTPARPAQTPEAGKLHAETYEAADAGPEQGSLSTAETITEPADAQIKAAVPDLPRAQVLPAAPQTETTKQAGSMEDSYKASDADPEQGYPVDDADAARMIGGSGSLEGRYVSDLLRAIIFQTPPDSEKPVPNPTTNPSPAADLSGSAGADSGNKPFGLTGRPQPSHSQPPPAGSTAAREKDRPAGTASRPVDLPKPRTRSNSSPQKSNRRPPDVSAESKNAIRPRSEPSLRTRPAGKNRPFVPADFESLLVQADIKSNRRNALAAVMRLWNLKLAQETDFDGLKNDLQFFQQAAAASDLSIQAILCDLEALERKDRPCILELYVPSLHASRYVALKTLCDRGAIISAGGKAGDTLITMDQLAPYWTGAVYIPQKKSKGSVK